MTTALSAPGMAKVGVAWIHCIAKKLFELPTNPKMTRSTVNLTTAIETSAMKLGANRTNLMAVVFNAVAHQDDA